MKGIVSFHPLSLEFFDEVVAPLAAGKKINPERFVVEALRLRRNAWVARRYAHAIRDLLARSEPQQPDPKAKLWDRVKSQLERMDHRPDASLERLRTALEPELHLDGRPFFVAEGSAEKAADAVEAMRSADSEPAADRLARLQLSRLDPELSKTLEGIDGPSLSSDLMYRQDLLAGLTQIFEIGRAARDGRSWSPPGGGAPRTGDEAVVNDLPCLALDLHARHVPFWTANDVDGLETVCRAAGVLAPECLVPAWRLFAELCEKYPRMKEALHLELRKPLDLGAFVGPGEIGNLLEFLNLSGAKIIQVATRAGEGPAATTLLRKIKECAVYAQKKGFGYLEACGIVPPERVDEVS